MKRPILLLLGALLVLAACGTTRYRNSAHPGYGQAEYDRDWYDCKRENTQTSAYVSPYFGSAGPEVNYSMAESCMAARGWRPVTSSETPPAPLDPAASTIRPEERARTERFQRFAREQLAKPYYQAPAVCGNGVWTSVKSYVVDLSPRAEAAGLRKGDRLLAFGGISLAQYDPDEAWSKVPRGDEVTVRVDRGGTEVSIGLPCRDNPEAWQAFVTTARAVVDGQWQACVDGIQTYSRVTRMTSASALRVTWECMRERGKAAGQRLPDEYWRVFHAWATKSIEECHYRPTGLTEVRTQLLDAADVLEKQAGRPTWANDIRQQIATFDTSSKP